jgi:hypothetical protein
MERNPAREQAAQRKSEAFEQLQPAFEASFRFVQEVHGQRRFSAFHVAETVRYLHALWVCECKDRLLSVYRNIVRYEGQHCLRLLQRLQKGEADEVIAFLHRKLDGLPFAELTRQIQEAKTTRHAGDGLARRLVHGRLVLLNRGMNLMQALDAIFALSDNDLRKEVRAACAQYGHRPDQIEQQLAEIEGPLHFYVPHPLLAQRNMVVMNRLGINVLTMPIDLPGERSWKVVAPTEAPRPFAEHVIAGSMELVSPSHNNLKRHRFVDRPEQGEGVRM